MLLFTLEFTILAFCGILRPRGCSSGLKKYLYNAYTVWAIIFTYTFAASGLVEFTLSSNDLDAAVNNCFMLLTVLGICYKMANCIIKRDEIMKLTEMLGNGVFQPRGDDEIAIQMKFNERSRNNTLFFSGLSGGAVTAITVVAFLGNVPQRSLPFKGWLPFDYSSNVRYWITFLHQIFAHAMAASIGAVHDALFHAIMIQACAQLNILKSRLRLIPETIGETIPRVSVEMREKQEIRNCVRYHQEIVKFVELSNSIFSFVIFVQFSVSTFVICVSTYMLSKTSFLSSGFLFLILYVGCMLVQIFLICWYGNEVIVESIDVGAAIYEMNWDSLLQNTQKDLRLMMARAHEPIRYTSGHVITLSLDSYNSLMKFSYSIYNLLQQTSL